MLQIPQSYYRNDTVHRTLGGDLENGVLSCGFLHKKTRSASDQNITFSYYGALLLLSGQGEHIDSDGQSHRLYPGCFIQRIPGKPHSTLVHPDGNWLEFFICFGRGLFQSLDAVGILDGAHDVLYPGVNLAILDTFVHFMDLLRTAPEDQLPLVLAEAQRIIFTIYGMHRRNQASDENRQLIDQARELIHRELQGRQSVHDLCRQLGIGYERFRKLFKEIVGVAPGEYILQGKMNLAKSQLLETDHSVKRIALDLGFADAFTFSRQFKNSVGVSPTEFKRKY